MEVKMKRLQVILTIGLVMALVLACSVFGGDQNNTQDDQQNQNNTQEEQNADNNQTGDDNQNNNATSGNDDTDDKPPTTGFGGDDPLWDTDFGKLLVSGDLEILEISANADEETVGEILTIQVTNTGTEDIVVQLPCGLVFAPEDSDNQALMVVQSLEISLAVGETAEFTPYVVCIEMAALAPSQNSGYSVSHLAGGDLLSLAECFCGQQISRDVDSMDSVGVQFAAWSVATGGDPLSEVGEEDTSAMAEFIAEMEASGMGEMVNEMLEMFGGEWLDVCGITVGE
jgi:hypothetical protein